MNRRDLLRSTLLTIGAATVNWQARARAFDHDYDASAEVARADWKPVFLDAHQNETLIALSDTIIPATDTPGAKAALVNRFLDLLISSESPSVQREFVASLAYMDLSATQRYKVTFRDLTPEEKNDLLHLLAFPRPRNRQDKTGADFAGYRHFSRLKTFISEAFYSSPVGLKELGWDGSPPHGQFSGCTHSPGDHDNAG
jgi:gluconate 2-dehydrogenase gamma chain